MSLDAASTFVTLSNRNVATAIDTDRCPKGQEGTSLTIFATRQAEESRQGRETPPAAVLPSC